MKHLAAITLLLACHCAVAGAQTFTQRLQKEVKNQGTVTITQSAEIDELVNGSWHKRNQAATGGTQAKAANATESRGTKPGARANTTAAEPYETAEGATPDTRKKVMRGAYKADGYRVQAFAGGNTRRDRQQAERIGNEIKALFPTQPIYVHFYSPRWICRVGNYRTYEEAHQMLTELRKLGYKQALIVKGKITVQY